MMQMILWKRRDYQVVPVPEGAIPAHIIDEQYPTWFFLGDANTTAEADSKIECDRARRKSFCW